MNSPFPLSRLGLLWLFLATALASGQALGQDQSIPGQSMAEPAMPPKAAPPITGGEAKIAPKAGSPMEALDALGAVIHSNDGTEETLAPPARLRSMMVREKGAAIVKPIETTGDPKQITPTTVDPYAAIGLFTNGCTGVMVDARFVLTAAFCVYDPEKKVWDTNLDFWPAVDAGKAPFGSAKFKKAYAPKGFVEKGDWNYNFALVELQSNIGEITGWMGFGYNASFPYPELNFTGFPAGVPDFTMWQVTCKVIDKPDNFVLYGCPGKKPLEGGPGAPMWILNDKGAASVRGIHLIPIKGIYAGHRFTQETFETVVSWIEGKPVATVAQ